MYSAICSTKPCASKHRSSCGSPQRYTQLLSQPISSFCAHWVREFQFVGFLLGLGLLASSVDISCSLVFIVALHWMIRFMVGVDNLHVRSLICVIKMLACDWRFAAQKAVVSMIAKKQHATLSLVAASLWLLVPLSLRPFSPRLGFDIV